MRAWGNPRWRERRNLRAVHLALLGPLEVHTDEGLVSLGAPKERAVLEMLALRSGRPVPTESLLAGLWDQGEPRTAPKVLQTYVSHLRRALPPDCVVTTSSGYMLQLEPEALDARCFELAVAAAARLREAGNPRRAAEMLREALALWRGRPCPELVEHSWATAEVARLEELRRVAQEDLADARLAVGDHTRLVGELEAAVEEEPLRERRWGQLILALYRAGRQADALRAFARLRSTLAVDLGVEPSPELVALEQSVLLHSPRLNYNPLPTMEPGATRPSLGRRAGAMPAWLTSFVGRDEEVAQVGRLVSERRLVTLAGSGGCGKTRLASEVATKMVGHFPGGTYFAALAPVTDNDLVGVAVAAALGVRPQSERSLVDVVAEVIGRRQTLAVIDNCEHVVNAVAQLVEELLAGAPGLRVLVTSRDPLRVGAETVWRVPGLAVPRPGAGAIEFRGNVAVGLFVDRARSAKPSLRLNDDALVTIADITRRLDGMPLAIELAAARVGVLDLTSILGGLNDRFSLLTGGSRTAPPRQQTLRAAVGWSYNLLNDNEKDLFCRLSVFPGSFSLEAALAVAGQDAPGTKDDFFGLVSKSMLTVVSPDGAPTRYGLLETLRQFGAAQLDEQTTEQALAHHARFYLGLVHALGPEPRGPQLSAWMRGVDLEFDNVRSTLSYLENRPQRRAEFFGSLIALRRYWIVNYLNRREGLRLLERALGDPGLAEDARLAAWVFATASSVAFMFDTKVSARYAATSADLAFRSGDANTAALASATLAQVRSATGQGNEAEAEQALKMAREVKDPLRIYEALLGILGTTQSGLQSPVRRRSQQSPWWSSATLARGRTIWEEILEIGQEMADPNICLHALLNLAPISYVEGDREQQRAYLERYLILVEELGLEPPLKYIRLAEMALADGQLLAALEALEKGMDLACRGDQPVRIGEVSVLAASCALTLGSGEAAARLYGFGQHELAMAGFANPLAQVYEFEHDSDVLASRLGEGFAVTLREGAAMTREEAAQLLSGLRDSVPSPMPEDTL